VVVSQDVATRPLWAGTGYKEQVAMEIPCGKQERLIGELSFVGDTSSYLHLELKVVLMTAV
jgi:hypothetical protein